MRVQCMYCERWQERITMEYAYNEDGEHIIVCADCRDEMVLATVEGYE